MLNKKSILITGGTGSFGNAFVKHILQKYKSVSRIVIFSRDELKQYTMQQQYPKNRFPNLRFFLGDVRDKERLIKACNNVDFIIHAAALKQVEAAEYNPIEFIETNIRGAQNIIEAAIYNNVKKIIALSTDKAAAPINLYGATKMCSDKLFIAANNFVGDAKLRFSVVRYGNVFGSRGSVLPTFLLQKNKGFINITNPEMTRFHITLSQSVDFVLNAIKNTKGGEILIPKLPSYNIMTFAKAVAPKCHYKIIGLRPGEKIHEEMITSSDSYNTLEFKNHYSIMPKKIPLYKYKGSKYLPKNFNYNSRDNKNFLTINDIKKLIKDHYF